MALGSKASIFMFRVSSSKGMPFSFMTSLSDLPSERSEA
jgi:hypothetical protein